MFTGIIEEIGTVRRIEKRPAAVQLTLAASRILDDIHIGDSIAVNGVCLTVTRFDAETFSADVMHESLDRSSLGNLRPGSPVNLERAMPAQGRFGGHIVTGHIDGTGKILSVVPDGCASWYTIETSDAVSRYIVEKGSVALDGISLTVAAVNGRSFKVSIIPHTGQATTLSGKKAGDILNIENDCIGKYVEKLLTSNTPSSSLTRETLLRAGF